MASILVVTTPQQAGALPGQPVGGVGTQRIVGHQHVDRRRVAGQRSPIGVLRLAVVVQPGDLRGLDAHRQILAGQRPIQRPGGPGRHAGAALPLLDPRSPDVLAA